MPRWSNAAFAIAKVGLAIAFEHFGGDLPAGSQHAQRDRQIERARVFRQLGRRLGKGGNGLPGTNPEQLFAAGYSACFLGALRFVAGQEKVTLPADTTVTAEVGIGPRSDGGFGITANLTIRVPGFDHAKAQGLDFSRLLYRPPVPPEVAIFNCETQDHGLGKALDHELIAKASAAAAARSSRRERLAAAGVDDSRDQTTSDPHRLRQDLQARHRDHREIERVGEGPIPEHEVVEARFPRTAGSGDALAADLDARRRPR